MYIRCNYPTSPLTYWPPDKALVSLKVHIIISDGMVVDVFVLLDRILETYHAIGDVAEQINFQINSIYSVGIISKIYLH